jgi:AcrR family transcriptional regulator
VRGDTLIKTFEDPGGTAARILDAAEATFAERGFAGTATREIARRAGVPFGTLHYHWGSKQQLWEAVFQRLADRTRATVLAGIAPGRDLGALVDSLVDSFLEFFTANRPIARLAYRTALEPRDAHLETVHAIFRDLERLGLGLYAELAPEAQLDRPVTLFVLANAFVAAVVDEPSQEAFLGGSVFAPGPARERLRAELKRIARAILALPADRKGERA